MQHPRRRAAETRSAPARRPGGAALAAFWREHGLALLLYALLGVGLSWPAVRDFSTRLISDNGDAKDVVWTLWHVLQTVRGQEPLFFTPLLFYPQGITLLLHSGGGLWMGLFALPFWPWGPVAAYNGSLLVGLGLTGYCMYRLAHALELERGAAFFAGVVLQVAPIHLVGVVGHPDRVFLGLLPLTLLALHHTLDPRRRAWWALATALALLATALHSGYHFVFSVIAVGLFLLAAFLAARRDRRQLRCLLGRAGLLLLATLVLVGPFVAVTMQAAGDPAFQVDSNRQSLEFLPDLAIYPLPPYYSLAFGGLTQQLLRPWVQGLHFPDVETVVALSWTGAALGALAWLRRPREARRWLLLALLNLALSFGPILRALGQTSFTEYQVPIVLPYALLTALPGLDFIRAPGRFMLAAYVGLGIGAAMGLSWLLQRFPRRRLLLVGGALALLLLESWPRPWPQEPLLPVPDFYRQIAQDPARYGVLDLPFQIQDGIDENCTQGAGGFNTASFIYQVYQTVHHKGIAHGFSARSYRQHPFLADLLGECALGQADVRVNGRPAAGCPQVAARLAGYGYRYVVYHKTIFPGSPSHQTAQEFVQAVFPSQPPWIDDELVAVYPVEPAAGTAAVSPTVVLGTNWYPAEKVCRWAASPATVYISAPRSQPALLLVELCTLHDPAGAIGVGPRGRLTLQDGAGFSTTLDVRAGEVAAVELLLPAGRMTLTLSLAAGNFTPSTYGSADARTLSFAVRAIDLQVPAHPEGQQAPRPRSEK